MRESPLQTIKGQVSALLLVSISVVAGAFAVRGKDDDFVTVNA